MTERILNIVVASDSNLIKFIDPCLTSIRKCGYEPIFYNLGGLDFGISFESNTSSKSLQKFPKKPFVILDALSKLDDDQYLAWIDIDCIMQYHVDNAIDNYDLAVTFRKSSLNSGVSFWKKTPNSINFLNEWCKISLEVNGDQNALNRICKIPNNSYINKTLDILDAKVKVLDCKTFNNFFFKRDQTSARIIHYKSKYRDRFPKG